MDCQTLTPSPILTEACLLPYRPGVPTVVAKRMMAQGGLSNGGGETIVGRIVTTAEAAATAAADGANLILVTVGCGDGANLVLVTVGSGLYLNWEMGATSFWEWGSMAGYDCESNVSNTGVYNERAVV